ncbi:group ii plp decarboxylase [Anopheles darlingi]|uniref:Pyridoxal-dependent decarboxylase domain-containing protein 1 n=1 Tax=Anopheles darlingi TaxID=43151 RepID=W5JR08_ANODA|nr:pyridoxal-dependent decarboxylase domain-containing protein 1 [Anopheles darlingi]ETN65184.1 group ii plp decarboxylase [Anopheles darlingi]
MKEHEMENEVEGDTLAQGQTRESASGASQQQQLPYEIAAANVRSSLAEIETQTSNLLNRLENVRNTSHKKLAGEQSLTPAASPPAATSEGDKTTQQSSGHARPRNEGPPKRTPAEVMDLLERLLLRSVNGSSNDEEEQDEFVLPPLDEVSHLAVLQHATTAYLCSLERQQLARAAVRLTSDALNWQASLFKFPITNSTGYYRDDGECVLQALRMALINQLNDNRLQRVQSAAVYLSEMGHLFTMQHACRYLGLPIASIRVVPCIKTGDAAGQMDLEELERIITGDVADGWQPLFLMATAGSPITGASDNIALLSIICGAHKMWLHCQGHGLAAFTLSDHFTPSPKCMPTSLTLSLNSWFGVSGLPTVLVYQQSRNRVTTFFDNDPVTANRINCLGTWSALQALGNDAITDRIFAAFDSCRSLCQLLLEIEGISVLSKVLPVGSSEEYRDMLANATKYNELFELAVPTVVFQFDGRNSTVAEPSNDTTAPLDDREALCIEKTTGNAGYYDRLNTWLGQILMRDCPPLALELIEHESNGICLRYYPFLPGYGEQLVGRVSKMVSEAGQCIRTQCDILHATIQHRVRFHRLVEASGSLRPIELHDWAGLGGVQYVPEGWDAMLTDQTKAELNKLNSALVDELQQTDGAFSLGESSDGLICVRFGMVTSETDIEELLELVISTARSIQEHSKILDTMSEILKKGIEAATMDLQREAEEKLWQEGILRQVPLVGRVVNWWSPVAKETGMKGRSLNLTQGVVESTENIYKYHMQMTPKTSTGLGGSKGPPAPLVQKPIGIIADESQSFHSCNTSSNSELTNSASNSNIPPVLAKSVPSLPSTMTGTVKSEAIEAVGEKADDGGAAVAGGAAKES